MIQKVYSTKTYCFILVSDFKYGHDVILTVFWSIISSTIVEKAIINFILRNE